MDTRAIGRAMAPLWMAPMRAAEMQEELEAIGLEPHERYFPVRAAPLGEASAELVTATFFNFSPTVVARSVPQAWQKASPRRVLDAQLRGVDRALTNLLADVDADIVAEASDLMRRAAEAACQRPEGRPLFAAYAALPWPDEDHLALWHAHYLLREFRGDGHIAVLTAASLRGIEALAIHVALLPQIGSVFRASRGWTDDEWMAALEALASDGWLTVDGDVPTLTPSGAERREAIEARTDELDLPAYQSIGPTGCERLVQLTKVVTEAFPAVGPSLRGSSR